MVVSFILVALMFDSEQIKLHSIPYNYQFAPSTLKLQNIIAKIRGFSQYQYFIDPVCGTEREKQILGGQKLKNSSNMRYIVFHFPAI